MSNPVLKPCKMRTEQNLASVIVKRPFVGLRGVKELKAFLYFTYLSRLPKNESILCRIFAMNSDLEPIWQFLQTVFQWQVFEIIRSTARKKGVH